MPALERIKIEGFKSIRSAEVELRPLNVLIGANGSGKSNFIGVFRLLRELVTGNLRVYVGQSGGADSLLHFGRQHTERLALEVSFAPVAQLANGYSCVLLPAVDGSFVFQNEYASFQDHNQYTQPLNDLLGRGHLESELEQAARNRLMVRYVYNAMNSWRIYHFHDTSDTARVKQAADIHDNRFLRNDAGNLAAYLYMLRETNHDHYAKIVGATRQIAPFFDDFALRPDPLNSGKIRLEWSERGADFYFGASALSDGTLRFICLATLLLQPTGHLPSTILLDEPELGLHPAAITILASLLRSAAQRTQVIVSTQSVTLVNQFAAEDILVVEREQGETVFRRFDTEAVEHWLEEYGLGDLWEKNVLGGRPSA
jgi:predicted ATPase